MSLWPWLRRLSGKTTILVASDGNTLRVPACARTLSVAACARTLTVPRGLR